MKACCPWYRDACANAACKLASVEHRGGLGGASMVHSTSREACITAAAGDFAAGDVDERCTRYGLCGLRELVCGAHAIDSDVGGMHTKWGVLGADREYA